MPNLDYDPRNPTDLLGRPIKPGDIVAWGNGKIVEPLNLLFTCSDCRDARGL